MHVHTHARAAYGGTTMPRLGSFDNRLPAWLVRGMLAGSYLAPFEPGRTSVREALL
jgi:hypothetical protein